MAADRVIRLRGWEDGDLDPLAAMNADAEVMRYFPAPLTRAESQSALLRMRSACDRQGWGIWVIEVDGQFAGFTGLSEPNFAAHFTPCLEILWRLRREYWGQGIAFGAARQAEAFAFGTLRRSELVAFTTSANLRSRKLMERLGFVRNPADDFVHPRLPDDHPLRGHVLYRKRRPV